MKKGDSADPLKSIQKIRHLGEQLKKGGVRALYIGDGDHFATSVELNYTGAIVGFHPDLLFIEDGAEYQNHYDKREPAGLTNYFGDVLASRITNAKICPVDDFEISKLQAFDFSKRTSALTHSRIADRIVRRIESFYQEHHQMPSFAIVFGAAHFEVPHNLKEAVIEKLKAASLPLPKASSIKVYDEKGRIFASDLERHWFAPFQYTYGVGTDIPPGFPDICNPSIGVNVLGHKADKSR